MLTVFSSVWDEQNSHFSVPSSEIVGDLLVLHHFIGRHAVAELRVRIKLAVVMVLCCNGSNMLPFGAVAVDIFYVRVSRIDVTARKQSTCSTCPEDLSCSRPQVTEY